MAVSARAGQGADELIVGRLGAAHGVRGWIKVSSYTESPVDIFSYSPWRLKLSSRLHGTSQRRNVEPIDWRQQGKGLVVRLTEIDDRTAAEQLRGAQISVSADCLPALASGQYYWRDLIGLDVVCRGEQIGAVERLLETGANDVLIIRRPSAADRSEKELLVPCADDVIVDVDVDRGEMTIDWDLSVEDE